LRRTIKTDKEKVLGREMVKPRAKTSKTEKGGAKMGGEPLWDGGDVKKKSNEN